MIELKLEVGKRYKDGEGVIVEIVGYLGKNVAYPYISSDADVYMEDGRADVDEGSIYDLVEEIK